MAGRGPAPKPAERRAGHSNSDPVPVVTVDVEPSTQPGLPERPAEWDEDAGEWGVSPWPDVTLTWWKMWADSPLSDDFTDVDWSFLMDTAILHADFWTGNSKVAAELRLRVAKFGATPEDRLRLRIAFAPKPDADDPAEPTSQGEGARARRGGLTALPGGKASGQ